MKTEGHMQPMDDKEWHFHCKQKPVLMVEEP